MYAGHILAKKYFYDSWDELQLSAILFCPPILFLKGNVAYHVAAVPIGIVE